MRIEQQIYFHGEGATLVEVVEQSRLEPPALPSRGDVWGKLKRRVPSGVMQLVTLDHPKVTMPWTSYRWREDDCSRLRQLAHRLYLRRRRFAKVVAGLWWPIAALRLACRSAGGEAGRIARSRGAGPAWRQVMAQLWLAVRHNIAPDAYYHYRFYLPERRAELAKYIHHHDICVLFPHVRLPGAGELGNKRKFWATCRAKGLPGLPVTAFVEGGRVVPAEGDGEVRLPACGLFIKPIDWYCGFGTERWQYEADAQQWVRGSVRYNHEQMLAHVASLSTDHAYLVQPQVRNHPSMARWTRGGLSTVRVVTFRLDDAAQTIGACVRMPRGDAHVDNFHAGGIAAAVELSTGRLSAAVSLIPIGAEFSCHPDTGEQIEGAVLPGWRELEQLARTVHVATGYTGFVGWDVALTPEGPVVVEANFTLCVTLVQMCYGRPLSDMNFHSCFHQLLAHPDVCEAIAARDGAALR